MAPPQILLADCDAMFCAVARLVDPEGAGKSPLLVVGGRRGGRGVVCSASYEAHAFGVRSGMPISQAERLCPDAMFVPEWAPVVEPASIDEFYLAMTGTEAVYRHEPLAVTAARIRADVLDRTGLAVSIGGGTNRLVAKLAVERAKPRAGGPTPGVHIVPAGAEGAFLRTLDLAAIPGVGPRMVERLALYGLVRVEDALRVELPTLQAWFGNRTGQWLHNRIRGIGGAVVDPRGEAKSVSREETFPEDLASTTDLEVELLRLAVRVAHDLRGHGLMARTVTVKLRDFDFRTRQASRTLPSPVDSDRAVHQVAHELFLRLRRARTVPARLVGIGLSQFGELGAAAQLVLFPASPAETVETP
ncbi:MAG: DNA polymerase IV, partial [Gemmatimonadales bacterium]|nr:DNA polymerase IV [Gemmatimonadales bacterium]